MLLVLLVCGFLGILTPAMALEVGNVMGEVLAIDWRDRDGR
ncbi:hypothetical protein Gotri_000201 [Gossypium trilobum]|uniref:Uncharacterized protein n=1 Tax=Gossypium trilobum TaxID=34281 RepID=A0A7J9FS46_9ROSI|nr:hypothetical protein [Gossypium trilobum]